MIFRYFFYSFNFHIFSLSPYWLKNKHKKSKYHPKYIFFKSSFTANDKNMFRKKTAMGMPVQEKKSGKRVLYVHDIVESQPEMAGAAGQNKKMPDFMKSESSGKRIRASQCIDNGTAGVKQSPE